MRVLVLRQPELAARTADLLGRYGIEAVSLPLERLVRLDPAPGQTQPSSFIVTSANALHWLARHFPPDGRLVFAVGPGTAEQARALGFNNLAVADGNATSLAALIIASGVDGPLLYLAGRVRRPVLETLLREAGFAIDVREVYAIEPVMPPGQAIAAALGGGLQGVMLLSAGQAKAYAQLAGAENLTRSKPALFCLSDRIRAALPAKLAQNALVSPSPSLEDMAKLIVKHCCSI